LDERHSLDVVNELSQMTNHFNDRVLLPSVLIIAETFLILLVVAAAAIVNIKGSFAIRASQEVLPHFGRTISSYIGSEHRTLLTPHLCDAKWC